jgi:hypothetical protein
MDYSILCKEILDLNPKVRFAGICDDSGEGPAGRHKESSFTRRN